MALNKTQKKEIIDKLTAILKESHSLALVNINGIKNNDLMKLKASLCKLETNIKVVKKTLMNIALKNAGYDHIPLEDFKFNCAIIPSAEDPINIMKTLNSFATTTLKKKLIEITAGGFVKKNYLDQTTFLQFAYLPSAEELYAKLAFSLTCPAIKLIMDLKFLSGLKLVNALKTLTIQKT